MANKISNVTVPHSPKGPVQLQLSQAHKVYCIQAMQPEVTQLSAHKNALLRAMKVAISFPTCCSLKRLIPATAKRKIYLQTSSSPKLS